MLGHGYHNCSYAAVLPYNKDERGDWMLACLEGHKSRLRISPRMQHPSRSGNPRSQFLLSSILMFKCRKAKAQVFRNLRIHPPSWNLLCLCNLKLPYVMKCRTWKSRIINDLVTWLLVLTTTLPTLRSLGWMIFLYKNRISRRGFWTWSLSRVMKLTILWANMCQRLKLS
ncbi:hypothetical protein LINGRAHAP2_LOCUS31598 [Linum grandiflorum]